MSDATKVKRGYLEAIEDLRIEDLPSRPFAIGYVRAYARTLGLDGEAAVERFKRDAPGAAEPLRPPVGVRKHKDARLSLLAGGGAVVVSAVLLWNLAQHAMADDKPPPPTVAEAPGPAAAPAPALGYRGPCRPPSRRPRNPPCRRPTRRPASTAPAMRRRGMSRPRRRPIRRCSRPAARSMARRPAPRSSPCRRARPRCWWCTGPTARCSSPSR
ncbi:MAG: helix-turn-helix domain-containing protein [Caulobacteraceae bacterium]